MSYNRSNNNQQRNVYPNNPPPQPIPVGIAPQMSMPMPQFTFPHNIRFNPYRNNNPTPANLPGPGDEPPSYDELYPSASSTSNFPATSSYQPNLYPPPLGSNISGRTFVTPYPPSTEVPGLPYPPPMVIYQPERSTRIPSSHTTRSTGQLPFPIPVGINGPESASAIPSPLAPTQSTAHGQSLFPSYLSSNQLLPFERNETGRPTLRPRENFNPEEDVKILATTLSWERPKKATIVNILCRRTLEQRLIINDMYKVNHEPLVETFKKKFIPGNLLNFLIAIMTSVDESNVQNLYNAIERYDYNVVPEILCTISNKEIKYLKNRYLITFSRKLETHITEKAVSQCKDLLLEICKGYRDETDNINMGDAITIAKYIHNIKEDHKYYLNVFTKNNFKQIKTICEQYERIFGCSIDTKIKKDFELFNMQGYLVIARFARNKHEFYAKRLHQSMKGLGTNDIQLMRIIITRCEVDLEDIKDAFKKITRDSLKSWIVDDTSGHFRMGLLDLLCVNYY